jgi:hypothetical protein
MNTIPPYGHRTRNYSAETPGLDDEPVYRVATVRGLYKVLTAVGVSPEHRLPDKALPALPVAVRQSEAA